MVPVHDSDDVVARLSTHSVELVDEWARYGDSYRLCNVRGTEGIIVALVERLN